MTYLYRKDVQGNICELLDNTGKVVVEYKYDAWGNHKVLNANGTENTDAGFIGNINPFRYRGYYYDEETNLYYLQSRYYDPTVCQFINADDNVKAVFHRRISEDYKRKWVFSPTFFDNARRQVITMIV